MSRSGQGTTAHPHGVQSRRGVNILRRGQVLYLDSFPARMTLLDWLRIDQKQTGTKEGCAEGDCGACTVVLRRIKQGQLVMEPVNACIMLLGQADGAELITVEDLAEVNGLHPIQQAMVDHHGSQCGFCTPGIVMSLFSLYHHSRDRAQLPDRTAVNAALSGNLCRCTGYRPIVDAAIAACNHTTEDKFTHNAPAVRQTLATLADHRDLFMGSETHFFAAPATQESLAELYLRHPDALLVGGATDVGLWITKGLVDLPKIIWLGRVVGFDQLAETDEALHLGATLTHLDATDALARIDPDLGILMRRFGSHQVRASGTVGGNLANGSPIGDLAPAFIALDATLHLRCGDHQRDLSLEDFFQAYRRQDRRKSEFITGVTIPKFTPERAGGAQVFFKCLKVSKRFDEDISTVMCALKIEILERKVVAARIAYGGMAGVPKRASLSEQALRGANLDEESTWQVALEALAEDFQPMSDQRASADYRRRLARNLLVKMLTEIVQNKTTQTRVYSDHQKVVHVEP